MRWAPVAVRSVSVAWLARVRLASAQFAYEPLPLPGLLQTLKYARCAACSCPDVAATTHRHQPLRFCAVVVHGLKQLLQALCGSQIFLWY